MIGLPAAQCNRLDCRGRLADQTGTADKRNAAVIENVIQMESATDTDDDFTNQLMHLADEVIDEPTLWCDWTRIFR